MIVAAQLFTIREFTKTPADLAKAYEKVAEIGYKAVQPSGHGPIEAEELKKVLDDNGLDCCSTHDKFQRFTEELEALIEDHKLWGCRYPAIGSLPGDMRTTEGFVKFAKLFDGIGERLAAEGMLFLYHNHDFEFAKYGGKLGMDLIMENSRPEHVAMEIDTHWVQAGGGDPAAWITKCAERGPTPVIHFKDYTMSTEGRERKFAEIGEGNLNWPAVLEACRAAKVEYVLVEQDRCDGDPFDSLKKSYDNLKAMGL
ncbi:MAG: sugar phosphate isomerase/epimerase family protein [Planctomycetota bacterium]